MEATIVKQIKDAIFYHDRRASKAVLAMAAKNPYIVIPEKEKAQLYYVVINSLNSEKVLGLLQKSILTAYDIPDYNLDNKIVDYVELLDEVSLQIDFISSFKNILENHQELLGDSKIILSGEKQLQTIGNWIADYIFFNASQTGDAMSEMKYLNTSTNAKTLTLERRLVLQAILKLYDRLAQYVEFWKLLPDKLPDDQLQEFETYYQTALEQTEQDNELGESSRGDDVSPENDQVIIQPVKDFAPPVDLSVKHSSNLPVSPAVISLGSPKKETAIKPVKPVKADEKQEPFSLGKKGSSIEQPKRGLVFDVPTNIDLSEVEAAAKKQEQKQQDINNKLEELKKRKKDDK